MLATQSLDFMGLSLDIIDHNQQRWLTAEQVGLALGYAETNARHGILKLYRKHADEFTDNDKGVVEMATAGGRQKVTIFSQSGCNLLSFFSNTPRAKQFRAWAKQVLVNIQKDPIERMANSVEKLAQGMDVIVRKLDHTDKYVGMLERNQRGHVKITWEVAEQVKDLYAGGMPQASIARELRISAASVNQIVKDKYVFSERAGVPTQLERDIQQEKHKLISDNLIQKNS